MPGKGGRRSHVWPDGVGRMFYAEGIYAAAIAQGMNVSGKWHRGFDGGDVDKGGFQVRFVCRANKLSISTKFAHTNLLSHRSN